MYISICFIIHVFEVVLLRLFRIINLRHFRFDLEVAKKYLLLIHIRFGRCKVRRLESISFFINLSEELYRSH